LSLVRHPHVVSTPHLGASTEEAQEKVAIQIAHQVADFLHGRGVSGSVNGDIVKYTFRKEFHPYFDLVERMGKLLAQLKSGELRSVVLTVTGGYLHELTSLLGAAFFKGVFAGVLTEPINYINALAIAKDRGISVSLQQADEHVLYANVISVAYETTRERRSFAGTVFGTSDERLIAVDGFHLDIRPQGILLLYSNVDRPGMLARVSTMLAQARINIGGLSLGRYPGQTKALTIVALDDMPSKPILDEMAKLEGISDVHLIFL
jgi:D-3-phosphoglycerate dehydrogenase